MADYGDPSGWGSLGGNLANQQPTTNSSSTGPFNDYDGGSSFDWGSNITKWLQLAPNIIASAKGNPYASGQYGQGSYGYGQGGSGQFGLQIPGAQGSLNISPIMMIGIGIALILVLKGRR